MESERECRTAGETTETQAERIADASACVFRVLEGQSLCTEWSDEIMMSVALRIIAALRDAGFIDLPEGV